MLGERQKCLLAFVYGLRSYFDSVHYRVALKVPQGKLLAGGVCLTPG